MELIEALILIGLAVVPAFVLLEYYLKKDIHDKEPERLIWKVFRWGMLVVVAAGFVEIWVENAFAELVRNPLLYVIVFSAFLPGIVEETLKFWVVKTKIYNDPDFNEPMDGIMYTVVASLGFAALENVLYLFTEGGFAGGIALGLFRGALSVPAHALFSGIMGYYIGQAKFMASSPSKTKSCICKGLFFAILLHASFNMIVSLGAGIGLLVAPILLLLMFFFLRSKIQKLQEKPFL